MSRRTFWVCLCLAFVLGSALRLHRLDAPSVWADELFQVRDALHYSIGDFQTGYYPTRLGLVATGHPVSGIGPTDFSGWAALGIDEWDMRIGTALVACISILLLPWASAKVLGFEAAAAFSVLFALSTWHLDWSQNARFYAPMFLYYNLALALYFRFSLRPSGWLFAFGILAALLAVRAKPTSLMLLAVVFCDLSYRWASMRRWPLSKGWTVGLLLGTVACAAAVFLGSTEAAPSDLAPFHERAVGESPLRIVLGNAFRVGIPVLLFSALGTWMLFRSAESAERRLLAFLGSAILVPLVSFGLLATTYHAEIRYTFVNTYGWMALASIGLSRMMRELWRSSGVVLAAAPMVLLAALALLDAAFYYESGYGYRSRFREAFQHVRMHREPGDLVYSVQPWVGSYYLGQANVMSSKRFEPSADASWLVVESQRYEIDKARPHPLDSVASLLAVFPTRVPFPQTTVRVYRASGTEAPSAR